MLMYHAGINMKVLTDMITDGDCHEEIRSNVHKRLLHAAEKWQKSTMLPKGLKRLILS